MLKHTWYERILYFYDKWIPAWNHEKWKQYSRSRKLSWGRRRTATLSVEPQLTSLSFTDLCWMMFENVYTTEQLLNQFLHSIPGRYHGELCVLTCLLIIKLARYTISGCISKMGSSGEFPFPLGCIAQVIRECGKGYKENCSDLGGLICDLWVSEKEFCWLQNGTANIRSRNILTKA